MERGYPSDAAAAALAGVGFMQLPGRILFAPVTERLSGTVVVTGLFLIQSLAIAIFLCLPNYGGLVVFVILFGMSAGAGTPSRAALTAERYGAERYGSISGVQSLTINGIRASAPFAVSLLRERTGDYTAFLIAGIGLSLFAAFAVFLHDRKPFGNNVAAASL
jgi:predicted MFS family arabinose efflux permease